MQERIVNESPRRRIARRVGAAGMALAAVLVLGACKAEGGGYVGEPFPGGPVGVYQGDANFGFNFTCEMNRKAQRARITGAITYHDSGPSTSGTLQFPAIRLHGIVDPFFVPGVSTCEEAAEAFPNTAQFEGTYRPRTRARCPEEAETAGSSSRCSTRVSRAAHAGRSPGTASPSNSSGAPTPPTPGAATSRAATSR